MHPQQSAQIARHEGNLEMQTLFPIKVQAGCECMRALCIIAFAAAGWGHQVVN